MRVDDLEPNICTLHLKVKREGYAWLNVASIEVNAVWNFAKATSYRAARPFAGPSRWLSGQRSERPEYKDMGVQRMRWHS
jgi:hypothetical protein